ncbi:MAG: citrate transporter [Clostridia bacterium]|nr:citrate transporter [Clostridia bacterium]
MAKVKDFLKSEIVLVVSFVLAVASMFVVLPNEEYINYIDFKTLALLFCLMAVVAGVSGLGVFDLCAKKLLNKTSSLKGLGLILSLLCFFSSMVITNDVALITFVPFTIVALKMSSNQKAIIPLVAVETVAANLGSMLTPIGNPQNLYLFSFFEMGAGEFIEAILPYAVLSLILVIVSSLVLGNGRINNSFGKSEKLVLDYKKLSVYAILFVISLLTVFRVIPYYITLALTVVCVLIFDKKTIKKVDYSLLLTFIFLFVFIGNLGEISVINEFLQSIVKDNEVLVGIASSQVFSNVPAALLLSGFTNKASDLLVGVNLGGLGTLIASMASLISFKFIAKEDVKTSKYIFVFTVINIVFLAANLLLYIIIR